MIERHFKREITVERPPLNYTTYVKYYSKRFKNDKDLHDYIDYLRDKSCEHSVDVWTVSYYIKVDNINKYIRLFKRERTDLKWKNII